MRPAWVHGRVGRVRMRSINQAVSQTVKVSAIFSPVPQRRSEEREKH